ncbi:3-keto-5-aminohexanoate cleavage protein [Ruegeria lacuscaerulensis]|uniref:3-keto-5-aminohexanoate cleavage protein n=1 Tax=Ruegeria lacuscaerulensis TaxID=55218 RepID=UPI00147DB359|nr:3-keto-5-aminohexanoate cleavage protein [Ruegeria lacuscaerulensis]
MKHTARPYVLVAPNGARRTSQDHAELPVGIDDIVSTAKACFSAGAHGLHLHVRDAQGAHSLDPGRYLEAITELRRAVPGMDIQITTEAAGIYDVAEQLDYLTKVQPEWVSISVREIARSPELAANVYAVCAEMEARVQHILYDAEDAALLSYWQADGTVKSAQTDRLLVLGRYTQGQESALEDLDQFPLGVSPWMVCAFGKQEHAFLCLAASRGGDVRVGFENSLYRPDGTVWADNAASVSTLVTSLKKGSL